jgi:Ca2+-transporting ATPase
VSAVLIAFITSIANEENASILTAVQLLWINLIMVRFVSQI